MSVDAEPAAPTIYDVARAAGVSIASVSRVLNGRRNPSAEIRDRVRRAATELGYVPDSAARSTPRLSMSWNCSESVSSANAS